LIVEFLLVLIGWPTLAIGCLDAGGIDLAG
jgi:hypothetical protein